MSFERRSLSDDAERFREPEDSFGFGWICDIAAQRMRKSLEACEVRENARRGARDS